MSTLACIILTAAALAAVLPAAALLFMTLAAGRGARPRAPVALQVAPRVAVLVPAHNESRHLLPTLESLRAELAPRDTLLVVAHNCSDDTADVAREAGARVLVRYDPARRGKGYALAAGIEALAARGGYDVVVIVDADCQVQPGSIRRVAAECALSRRPVQMLNLMQAPPGAPVRVRIMEFAWVVKNVVRPLAMQRLGGACHLTGTGMALPMALAATADLATGHIAEDMQLGVKLALAGTPPMLSLSGTVRSQFPLDPGVARLQKSRWEHGTLSVQARMLPDVWRAARLERSPALYALALDLLIPPTAMYVAFASALWALAFGLHWTPMWPAAAIMDAGMAMLGLAVCLAWWRHARHILHAREALGLAPYVLWKLPVYAALLVGRRAAWVRTARH